MLDIEDLEDEIDIDLVVFDLDGTIADTAKLFEKDIRRRPYDVLRYSDHSSVSTPLVKIPNLKRICNDLIQCGVRVAVITNSPRAYASTLCFLLGIDFDVLIAANNNTETNTKIQKLKWMSTKNALVDGISIDASRILYIGDRLDDESAAHATGCQFEWDPGNSRYLSGQLLQLANHCSDIINSRFKTKTSLDALTKNSLHNKYIANRKSAFECFGDSGAIGFVVDPNGPQVSADHFVVTIKESDDAAEFAETWENSDGDLFSGIFNSLEPHSAIQRPIIDPRFVTRYDYDHQPEVRAQIFQVLSDNFAAVKISNHLFRPELRDTEIYSHFKWSSDRIAHDLWKQIKNWSDFSSGSEVELLNLEFVALCMAASIGDLDENIVIVPMPSSSFSESKPGRVSNRLARRISELLDVPYFELFIKDENEQVQAIHETFPLSRRAILVDDQITNGSLATKCVEIMQELNHNNFEIRSWSASKYYPMPASLQSGVSRIEQVTEVIFEQKICQVGMKVHNQKYGIGVINMVGEFYLEIDFSNMGIQFLSREDLELDFID